MCNNIHNNKVYKEYYVKYDMRKEEQIKNDVEVVSKILKTRSNGFSITQVKEASNLPKCAVVSALNKLDGAGKVDLNIFGRNEVYSWRKN